MKKKGRADSAYVYIAKRKDLQELDPGRKIPWSRGTLLKPTGGHTMSCGSKTEGRKRKVRSHVSSRSSEGKHCPYAHKNHRLLGRRSGSGGEVRPVSRTEKDSRCIKKFRKSTDQGPSERLRLGSKIDERAPRKSHRGKRERLQYEKRGNKGRLEYTFCSLKKMSIKNEKSSN